MLGVATLGQIMADQKAKGKIVTMVKEQFLSDKKIERENDAHKRK